MAVKMSIGFWKTDTINQIITFTVNPSLDAQSFSNSFEGVLGVVKNLGAGPLFLCVIEFL
jgi:hypothetical protein